MDWVRHCLGVAVALGAAAGILAVTTPADADLITNVSAYNYASGYRSDSGFNQTSFNSAVNGDTSVLYNPPLTGNLLAAATNFTDYNTFIYADAFASSSGVPSESNDFIATTSTSYVQVYFTLTTPITGFLSLSNVSSSFGDPGPSGSSYATGYAELHDLGTNVSYTYGASATANVVNGSTQVSYVVNLAAGNYSLYLYGSEYGSSHYGSGHSEEADGGAYLYNIKAAAVPVPGSLVLLCTGLASIGGIGWMTRWQQATAAA
jgi:hypothetical protein